MDRHESVHELADGRELLERLSATGDYVFHGSSEELEELEPRQQAHVDHKTGKVELDGKPAVCASSSHEIAIFRALISAKIAKKRHVKKDQSAFGVRNGELFFKATPELIRNAMLPDSVGYVYVFRKRDFLPHSFFESRAYQSVKPVRVVAVKGKDLPQDIQEI